MNMTSNRTIKRALQGFLGLSLVICSGPLLAAEGAALYTDKACIACHGANGSEPVMDAYPKIGGQSEIYLLAQMKDIKSGARSNSHAVAMTNIMDKVSDEEMAVIAKWLSEQTK